MWTRIRAPVYCALPEIERAIPAAAPAVEQLAVQSRHDADGHNRARGMSDAQHPGTDLAQSKSRRLEDLFTRPQVSWTGWLPDMMEGQPAHRACAHIQD